MLFTLLDTISCLDLLFTSAGGPQWKSSANWQQSDNICERFGVECEDGIPVVLDLTRNNLQGTLPDCFINTSFKEIYLSHNNIFGPCPSVPVAIEYFHIRNTNITSLPTNICKSEIKSLRASLSKVKGDFLSCYLNIDDLDLAMLGLVAQQIETIQIKSTVLKISHNDLSKFTFIFNGQLLILDVTGTGVGGNINIKAELGLKQLSIASTELIVTGNSPQNLQVFDISYTRNEVPHPEQFSSAIRIIAAVGTIQYKFPYSLNDISLLSPDIFMDFTNTSFFCGHERSATTDCFLVQILNLTQQGNSVNFELNIQIKNSQNYSFIGLTASYENVQIDCEAIKHKVHCISDKQLTEIAVLFNNFTISASDANFGSEVKPSDILPEFVQTSGFKIIQQQIFEHNLTVTGMANCPDYTEFLEDILSPISLKYPQILSKFQFVFLPLSVPVEGFVFQTYAMHGQWEAYGDSVMTCAERIMYQRDFVESSLCYAQKPSLSQCFASDWTEIITCASENPYIEADSRYAYDILNSGPSPTAFIDNIEIQYEKYEDVVRAMCNVLGDIDICIKII
ncbi:hypothetical protein SS50377_25165 [Spironucleus salmonicida]|uniref:Uncharacterized protein n=1 Tax=Spironucleus salmonicida TaxID=348837 RepID=V6LSY4_9EUKA|nr:hypothetical protein SS50377_25165 [Spironucleus salmonicida]|eukprot:EST46806.1 hypothetical protein SS50377_13171 [Spironucleus salmonicida]